MEVEKLFRPHVLALPTGQNPRLDFEGKIFLDGNENPYGGPVGKNYHRYPDSMQVQLKEKISSIKGVPPQHIFLGNGSDETIDMLIRVFCEPGKDQVMLCPPTYERYEHFLRINNVSTVHVNMTSDFQLDVPEMLKAIDAHQNLKLLILCSPNNPTGNSLRYDDVEFLLNNFPGIVVIDEAYINYSRQRSFIRELTEYENLVVLQTFSKAWGLAGLRLGMVFSSKLIVETMDKFRAPSNINRATQEMALEAIGKIEQVNEQIKKTVEEKNKLAVLLDKNKLAEKIFPSDASFLLVRFANGKEAYKKLKNSGVLVSDSNGLPGCENCLRITVGTPVENEMLVKALMET